MTERELSIQWEEVYQRLHTPTFEAILRDGQLLFLFPDGQRRDFQRSDVEALTRFLDQYAMVEPLPAPDGDIFKDWQPTKSDLTFGNCRHGIDFDTCETCIAEMAQAEDKAGEEEIKTELWLENRGKSDNEIARELQHEENQRVLRLTSSFESEDGE
jgi:hypothetical protein